MDLIIRNVRLADRTFDEPMDIGIRNGRIVAIERRLAADAQIYDGHGCLACAGLIESHIHIDKSRIIDRCPPQEGREANPVKRVAPLKKSMKVEDVRRRASSTSTSTSTSTSETRPMRWTSILFAS